VLRLIPALADPRILVGAETCDDAAVYRLDDERAIVATVDYITPIVDDPAAWGAVAAANALSDVYAMGGRPLFALNVVGFPRDALPLEILGQVLAAGAAKAAEVGVPILGGHSVDDPEPKYGMVVIGLVHPARVVTNTGARPGDRIFLTKPLGTGIITTAIKRGVAPAATVEAALASMATLNHAASEAMQEVGVHAATDVTGFGLLGHLGEMALGSGVAVRVQASAVPLLPDALALATQGIVPGGTIRNWESLAERVRWHGALAEPLQLTLCDAQTSGGMLIAVGADRAAQLAAALTARGALAAEIGEVTGYDARGPIDVRP
jgi:selenide,water dikinase